MIIWYDLRVPRPHILMEFKLKDQMNLIIKFSNKVNLKRNTSIKVDLITKFRD